MNAELHVLAVVHHAASERLWEFARIENLEGGVVDIARNLAESHGASATEPRLKAPSNQDSVMEGIRPRKSSPTSRPIASMPSSWAGEEE
jgi:hypothetical protein